MIRLELSTAVAVYIFLTVVTILLLWMILSRDKKIRQYTSQKKYIWECTICTHTYVDSRHEVISKCPQCGSFNKKGEGK